MTLTRRGMTRGSVAQPATSNADCMLLRELRQALAARTEPTPRTTEAELPGTPEPDDGSTANARLLALLELLLTEPDSFPR